MKTTTGMFRFVAVESSKSSTAGVRNLLSLQSKVLLYTWLVLMPGFGFAQHAAGSVTTFTLVNADTDEDIRELKEGDVLNLAELPSIHLNIRANTDPAAVGSVVFALEGTQQRTHTENNAPYALFANNQADYFPWTPAPGSYTLTATPYSEPGGGGEQGDPLAIGFSVQQAVGSFTLVNADTDEDIRELNEGDVIDLAALPSVHLNIRANTGPAGVGSVVFALEGTQQRTHTENTIPYVLFANNHADYFPWIPTPGAYSLQATPYALANGEGQPGISRQISFTLTSSRADVSVYVGVPEDKQVVKVGQPVSLSVNVYNAGPGKATNIRIRDEFINILDVPCVKLTNIQTGPPNKPTLIYQDEAWYWQIESLEPGEVASFAITGKSNRVATIFNQAVIQAVDQEDPNSNNNSSKQQIEIVDDNDTPDIAVYAYIADEPGNADVNFAFYVTNYGPFMQRSIPVRYSTSGPHIDLKETELVIDSLPAGCTQRFEGTIGTRSPGTFKVVVNASAGADRNTRNNEFVETLTVPEDPTGNTGLRLRPAAPGGPEGTSLSLHPAVPNPFASSTTLSFRLEKESAVQLSVMNQWGGLVDRLLDKTLPAGEHAVQWQPRGLSSGVYVVQLRADGGVQARRIVMVR